MYNFEDRTITTYLTNKCVTLLLETRSEYKMEKKTRSPG